VTPSGWILAPYVDSGEGVRSVPGRIAIEDINGFADFYDGSFERCTNSLGFCSYWSSRSVALTVPFWSLTVMFGMIAGLPWYRQIIYPRFSLRAFLIACTIFALLMGYVVWQVHHK
jgi:hypothetical protein